MIFINFKVSNSEVSNFKVGNFMFVGRKYELETLNRLYNEDKFHFILFFLLFQQPRSYNLICLP